MTHCSHPHHSNRARLDELEYKDLVKELVPNNIPGAMIPKIATRDWAPLIPLVKYDGYKKDTFRFFVPNHYNGWYNYYRWDEYWDQVHDTSVNAMEAARLLLWGGNLRFHCNCPSFSFHGYQYIATQLDSAIYAEERFPKKMNPTLEGWGCKHLRKSMKVLPFNLSHVAAAIKEERRIMTGAEPTMKPYQRG